MGVFVSGRKSIVARVFQSWRRLLVMSLATGVSGGCIDARYPLHAQLQIPERILAALPKETLTPTDIYYDVSGKVVNRVKHHRRQWTGEIIHAEGSHVYVFDGKAELYEAVSDRSQRNPGVFLRYLGTIDVNVEPRGDASSGCE